ncbi:hypothetical protein, partial [Pseudomonas kurunegalensis]
SLSSVYFEVFAKNLFNFKHLTRFDLSSREVNSTAFKNAVNHLFTTTDWLSADQEKRWLLLKDKTPTCMRR